ncbi:MAG: DUF4097 domain-containing protein [Gemmatimonadota bacterium]
MLSLAGLIAVAASGNFGIRGVEGALVQEFRWSGRVARGKTVEVKGINGDIRAASASGGDVEVLARKRGRKSDAAEVKIEVVEHSGGVTICAVYPDKRKGRRNKCAPGSAAHLSANDNDVEVDFTVRLPGGVRFVGQTVNGDVEASSLGGDVRASTVNGDVRVSTSGLAEASTVNGSIDAAFRSANWDDELEFSTVNGSITLDLPADTNTEVRARTVNGRLETDFPLTISGRFSARNMRGTIGSGGRRLELSTVNGDIRLRRGG